MRRPGLGSELGVVAVAAVALTTGLRRGRDAFTPAAPEARPPDPGRAERIALILAKAEERRRRKREKRAALAARAEKG